MPLMNCPVCNRAISTEAEACPQCGHPNRVTEREQDGPHCYACSAVATTKCQSCGALSCVLHLESIYVSHGRGGAYELRCASCHSAAVAWKIFGFVLLGGMILIVLIFWSQMGR